MRIEDFLSTIYFKSKEQLMSETGIKNERTVRGKLSELKLNKVVVFNSKTKGYRLAKPIETTPTEDLLKELEEVRHAKNDINSRARDLDKQLRTYIAWEYDALKEIERRNQGQLDFGF